LLIPASGGGDIRVRGIIIGSLILVKKLTVLNGWGEGFLLFPPSMRNRDFFHRRSPEDTPCAKKRKGRFLTYIFGAKKIAEEGCKQGWGWGGGCFWVLCGGGLGGGWGGGGCGLVGWGGGFFVGGGG